MKALALSTAIVLGLAAPSLANDQLARALGVEPGQYTTAQLIALDRALESDNYRLADHIRSGGGNVFGLSAAGAQFAATQAEQDDEGPVGRFRNAASGAEIISTQSFAGGATDAGRDFAIEHAREQEDLTLLRVLEAGGSLNSVQSLY